MPRRSAVQTRLTPEDRADFDRLIGEGRMVLDDLVSWLSERGYEISRSAVHRHSSKVAAMAQRIRDSRQITEALVADLGDAAVQGQQGRLLVEAVRAMVLDLVAKLGESGEGLSPKDAAMLGRTLADLGKALRSDQDFETRILDRARAEERERAAQAVEVAAKGAGLSADTIEAMKLSVFGAGA